MLTLRELINHVLDRGDLLRVISGLYTVYHDTEDDILRISSTYTDVIRQLIELPPASDVDCNIILTSNQDENGEYVEVNLYDSRLDELTACDYVQWKELIDCLVEDKIGLSLDMMLVHVISEITFHGFTQQQIDKRKAELRQTIRTMSDILSGDDFLN